MTKSDKVRRLMAKAQINGVDEEKLIKQVMKSCEFTRGLAVTYIRKNKGTAALRATVKALREKAEGKPVPAAKPATGKKRGRPAKAAVAPEANVIVAPPAEILPVATEAVDTPAAEVAVAA